MNYWFIFSITDIEVACYKYEGVDAVKAALNKGLELSTEDMPIKVRILFPFFLFFITFQVVYLIIVDKLQYIENIYCCSFFKIQMTIMLVYIWLKKFSFEIFFLSL